MGVRYWTKEGEHYVSDDYADLSNNLHRDDGPAIIYANGTKAWFQHGMRHREDGPAYIGHDGRKVWFLYDKAVTEEEFNTVTDRTQRKLIWG